MAANYARGFFQVPLSKEFWRDRLRRCFIGDRFRAVFAKLGDLAVIVGARLGAAPAIEAGFLV